MKSRLIDFSLFLSQTEHPRPEDIECLCKLLTTVGRPMDASKREIKRHDGTIIKTSEMMGAYFRRIETLIKSDALDVRHSFMLQDLVDLRNENWVERRKVKHVQWVSFVMYELTVRSVFFFQSEGPKKIGDIHRDAAIERSKSQQFDRQQSRGRGDRNNAQYVLLWYAMTLLQCREQKIWCTLQKASV